MIGRKVKKLFVFSLTAALVCALSSCDNLGTDDNASSLALVQNVTAAGEVLETRTFSGSVDLEGLLPQEFAGNSSAQENGGKTLFPSTPTSSSLTYSVSAACGTKSVTGSVNTTTNKFSIAIPFASTTESWKITLIAKSGSNIVLKSEKTVTYSTTGTSLSMPLNYYTGASTETGGISLSIPISTSGTTASGIQSASVSYGPVGETPTTQIINVSGSKIAWTKTGLAPGAYKVQIFFYSGTSASGSPLYVIDQQAMVYSNLTTSVICWHGSSKPEYATSTGAFETITKTMADNQKSVSYNGEVYLGGTGLAGKTASDSNSGSAFAPVLTLYKALEIVNGLAATDSSKEYVVHVKADVAAGTGTSSTATTATATVNSGVKVKIIGDQTSSSSWRAISGGTTAGTYKITSSGTVTVQYLKFSNLSNIQVAAGKLTINNCNVSGGTQGGFLVSSGATLESTAGLSISGCSRVNGGGGISCDGTLTLTGTTISGCKATYSSSGGTTSGCGGALLVSGSSASATLTTCTIGVASPTATASSQTACSNYAAKMGGGIYIYGGAAVSLKSSSTVQYNYAAGTGTTDGGGGVFVNNGTIDVVSGTIGYNGAATNGGGLCISSSCAKAIELKGNFYKNSAANGGAIYTASGAAVTTPTSGGPTIGASGKANTATNGGGIYIASTGVSVAYANIDYNTAACGAGVYVDEDGGATFGQGSYIRYGTASSYGGGIYNKGSLYLSAAQITSNKAVNGAGVWSDSKVCLYQISSSYKTSISSCETTGTSGKGGGIYVAGGGVYIGYSEYQGTTKTEADWSGFIQSNTANQGAGVYVAAGTLVMRRGTIGGSSSSSGNTASSNGGGVYLASGATLEMSGNALGSGKIQYNTSGASGGGVYCLGTLTLDYGNIVSNSATTSGGGVYLGMSGSTYGRITMGSGAYIPPGTGNANDIYFEYPSDTKNYITIKTTFATSAKVGCVTIPSSTADSQITTGLYILKSGGISGTTFENCLKQFVVSQVKSYLLKIDVNSGVGRVTKDTMYASDFIVVNGTEFEGASTVSGSSVFIKNRALTIPKLHVCIHEVTQKEYQTYCNYGERMSGFVPNTGQGLGDNWPTYFVNWYDCIIYCNLRSIAEGLTPCYTLGGKTDPKQWTGIVKDSETGKCHGPVANNTTWDGVSCNFSANGWRLPREAEWEYLARGAKLTGTQYDFAGSNDVGQVAWYDENATKTQVYKSKDSISSSFPLYDMSGNVWEYCWDWWDTITSSTVINGPASSSIGKRVVRGGGFNSPEAQCKVGYHDVKNEPFETWANCGFRIVRTLE